MIQIEAKLIGIDRLERALKKEDAKAVQFSEIGAEVGYATPYAIYVHENTQAKHPNGGQAKFLEQPARQNEVQIGEAFQRTYEQTKQPGPAFLSAAQLLKALSKPLVPVDTGDLVRSGYAILIKRP